MVRLTQEEVVDIARLYSPRVGMLCDFANALQTALEEKQASIVQCFDCKKSLHKKDAKYTFCYPRCEKCHEELNK